MQNAQRMREKELDMYTALIDSNSPSIRKAGIEGLQELTGKKYPALADQNELAIQAIREVRKFATNPKISDDVTLKAWQQFEQEYGETRESQAAMAPLEKEGETKALGQGIAGRRQIAETLRTTPELAQTPEALESAKQDVVDLLLAGGVEGRKAALELDTLGQPSADPKTQFDQTKKLRDEFIKASGDFVKLRDSFGKIAASAKDPSAAGDVSMIFAFMKMLDPTSVVREGEQATAANARGIPEGVRTLYNRVISGQRLGENQRKDFVDRAKRIMSVDKERHERRIGVFNNLAKSFDLDPRQVTIDLFDPDINIDELLATSPGTHVPDFDRWMVEARRANPDASEKDLRDFYTNKYGGI